MTDDDELDISDLPDAELANEDADIEREYDSDKRRFHFTYDEWLEFVQDNRDESIEEYQGKIANFVGKTGAIALLRLLDKAETALSFTQLRESFPHSSSTLNERRKEALELELVNKGLGSDDRGGTPVYSLSETGKRLHDTLDRSGVIGLHEQIRNLEQQLADRTKDAQKNIEDHFLYPEPVENDDES